MRFASVLDIPCIVVCNGSVYIALSLSPRFAVTLWWMFPWCILLYLVSCVLCVPAYLCIVQSISRQFRRYSSQVWCFCTSPLDWVSVPHMYCGSILPMLRSYLPFVHGDILVVMPGGRIALLYCVVTHPAASSFLPGDARTAGLLMFKL